MTNDKGASMNTLTLTTDNSDFIAKAKEVLLTLAKCDNVKISLDDDPLSAEYEKRADEALRGIGLINETEALSIASKIKSGTYAGKI